MSQMGTEFKVGIFTLIAAIIIGYMFFVLNPDTFQGEDYKRYYTVIKDAAGIVKKSHVKTNGVIIGKVTAVKLQLNQTRIEFEIEQSVRIPEGSKVTIKEKGLLGDVFLEIIRAEDVGSYLEAGDFIPPADQQASISALVSVAGSVGQDIKEVTQILAKVLGGKDGEENVAAIVRELRDLAGNSRLLVEENRENIRKIVDNFEQTTTILKRVIGEREHDLTAIVSNMAAATEDLRQFSVAMRQVLGNENREKIEKIIASFDSTMAEVEVTAKNVRLVADKLERGEGTLGKLINEDETISQLEATIKEVREILAPATKLQLAVDYHGELRKDAHTQHYFNTYMQTRPDKFYILGFTDARETVRETTYESIAVDKESPDSLAQGGNPQAVRERIKEKKAIRFNLQFAKRWGALQLRFGLFESTGGLASDFFLFNNRLRLTLEAFDWNRDSVLRRTAHLKTYVSILFFEHIYAIVGVDDPTRYDVGSTRVSKDLNYFLGAGLTFTDDDLKTIFGTAALAL